MAVAGAGHILATKVRAPARRTAAVVRDRLLRRLDDPRDPPLTVVVAPAGYGKSTLLAEWAGAADHPVAWLSLDDGDNDPARWWAHLLAAIASADGGSTAPTASAGGDPVADLAGAVLALLGDGPPCRSIVLDDYHVVTSPLVHAAVRGLVERMPAGVRLLIGSRIDPPLPLARLRARNELAELRAADLRFSAAEARTFLNGPMGLGLSPGEVDELARRTEGWIAALQLAALSLSGRDDTAGFVAAFGGDDRYVVDFLVEEVLDRVPDDTRTFLLCTSILDRFTAELCDAVTATRGSSAMLDRLERDNLFLVALDDRRRWFRYHHLFADVLRARLLHEERALVTELHRRAGHWFEVHGDRPAAIEHALAGDDVEGAARLIEMSAAELGRARQEATLRRWLDRLPEAAFDARPVLTMALVGARMAAGDTSDVGSLLDRIDHQLADPTDPAVEIVDAEERRRLPAQAAVYRAGLAHLADDPEATIAHAERARALAEPGDALCLGSAAALIGLAHWGRGELDEAVRRYERAIGHLGDAARVVDVLGCSLALADLHVAQGRPAVATAVCRDALALADRRGVRRGCADLYAAIAAVLVEQDRLDDATHELEQAAALGDGGGLPQHAYRRRVVAADLAVAHGRLDDAACLLDEAALVYDTDYSPSTHPVTARAARVDLLRGDLDRVARWATAVMVDAGEDLGYRREFEHVTFARWLVAAAEHARDERALDTAVALLERLRDGAERGGRRWALVDILVALAGAHVAGADPASARRVLAEALVAAADQGRVRVFVDTVPAVAPLLRSLSVDGAAERLRDRIVDRRSARPAPPPRDLAVELSTRERDVLRLLRTDLSGPEIARELHVSLNTLRTHTKSIYAKVGATSRRQAIRLAADLGH